ncbi:cytochrome P450 [Hygrophoropsis aurantiaca]|uniref:Cytochrome P450 n=1 Tax=Hygrophoropsis aurantiaca TaxID=72124 RepID=A0ACB8AKP2_9AGAM|nr:cytochrome P450 [Hygrophoropsis aurantiaca]
MRHSHSEIHMEGPPLPPGPTPLPWVGNVRGIDPAAPWTTYAEWGKIYGDVVYSRLFHQEIIIINTEKAATALMERRSHNFADKPVIATNDLLGMAFNTVLMPYGPRWLQHRRLFHQAFRADAAVSYRPIQMQRAHQLLFDVLEDPDDWKNAMQMLASSSIMKAVYDYDTQPRSDPFVSVIEKTLRIVVQDLRPEVAAIFSAFPGLLKLPSWLPGMTIKRRAAEAKKYATDWLDLPFQHVQKHMAAGTAAPSMVADALNKHAGEEEDEQFITTLKEASASAFAAGSETTSSALMNFVLAMVLYPEVQERAQALIDEVVGRDRLPTLEDRPSIPYIEAIIRETLRWAPILPLVTPHATLEDDIYEGYFIPKGAMIMPNIWAMTRNEERFPNPTVFNPDRFMAPDGNVLPDDTSRILFGFGRRNCVGRHFADISLWSTITLMLATFKFSKAKDTDGNVIDFEPKWCDGLAIHPLPFPCSITPRTPGLTKEMLAQIIRATA